MRIGILLIIFVLFLQSQQADDIDSIKKERQKQVKESCRKYCQYNRNPRCQNICYEYNNREAVDWTMFLIFGVPLLVLVCTITCLACNRRSIYRWYFFRRLKSILNIVDEKGDKSLFQKEWKKIANLIQEGEFLYIMRQKGDQIKSQVREIDIGQIHKNKLIIKIQMQGVDTKGDQTHSWNSSGFIFMKDEQICFWMHKCFQDKINHEIFVLTKLNNDSIEGKCDSFSSFGEYNQNLRYEWMASLSKGMKEEEIQVKIQQTSAQLIQS